MTDTMERTDIEVTIREELDKSVSCEKKHASWIECSETAVALAAPECYGNVRPQFICQNLVNYIDMTIAVGAVCGSCDRPIAECWMVVPI